MTGRDFVFWLQGYFEMNDGSESLSKDQTRILKKHLALVFKHEIDPSMGDAKHQSELNEIHETHENTFDGIPHPDGTDGGTYRC